MLQTFPHRFSSVGGILFPHQGSVSMRRLSGLSLALVVLFSITNPVFARVAPAPPLFVRVATTETILFGKVKAIEDKDAEVTMPGTTDKVTMRIAVVTVAEGLKSSGRLEKTIRVAFIPES